MSFFFFASLEGDSPIFAALRPERVYSVFAAKIGIFPSILLAEVNRGASLSESFRSHAGMGGDDVLLGLLMVAALVAALWAASRLLGLRRRRHGYNSPQQLFRQLCKAHHLTWSDRALVARVARHCGLRDPARLFLESQHWDDRALGPTFALDFVRLRMLRKQIFEGAAQGAEAGIRKPGAGRNIAAPLSDRRGISAGDGDRNTGLRRKTDAMPPRGGTTNTASPLLPVLPVPTLDLPPWTDAESVEG